MYDSSYSLGSGDFDNDGLLDSEDPFPYDLYGDLDGDGILDNMDPDIDGDGAPNEDDPDPLEADEGQEDEDTAESEEESTNEPIDTSSGSNYFAERRISVPCLGVPLEVDLKYQSVADLPSGSLGEGWRHSLEWSLDIQTNKVVLYTGDGREMVFNEDGNGGFRSPDSSNWTLEESAAGYEAEMPGGLAYTFNTNGIFSAAADAWGNGIECAYGTNGCLETATHSNGRQINFSNVWFAASNEWKVASVSVQDGESLFFSYNSDGQFTQVVEQVGMNNYTSHYVYADGYLTGRVNGAGFEYSYGYEYNTNGVLNGKGDSLDVNGYYEHEVEYVNSAWSEVRYSRRGTEQGYFYSRNAAGILKTKFGPGETVAETLTRGVFYNYASNNVDAVEETLFDDGVDETWSTWMLYDDAHNVTNVAVGYCTTNQTQQLSVEYDAEWNLPAAVIEPDGSRVETVYTNGSALVVKSFYSGTQSFDTHFGYTTNGWLESVTNANGHAVGYGYDTNGNLLTVSPEAGPVVTNSYDVLGFLKTTEFFVVEDEFTSRRVTEFGRDEKGRVEWIAYPDGLTNYYAYNALGYLTNSVDRAGRETDYTYAPTKKLTSVTRYLEQGGSNVPVRVGYDLDKQMNMLRISEPRGRYVESYQLDIQDRVTAVTNIEDQVMSVEYGVGDFVRKVTRFDGSTITNSYDEAGRMANISYHGGTETRSVEYSYYSDSSLKSVSDGTSAITNSYNLLNQITNQAVSVLSAYSVVNEYQYDPVGNLTNAVVSTADDADVSDIVYAYDAAERLEGIVSHEGTKTQSFDYSYNPRNGLVSGVVNTNTGIRCLYGYDVMERVDRISYYKADGSLIRSVDYDYDSAGMITNKTISGGTTSVSSYTYDSINRLTSETRASSEPSVVNYSYDLAGNRLSKTNNSTVVNYTLGSGNRLASWSASDTNSLVTDVRGTSSETIGTDDRWGTLWVSNVTAQAGAKPQVDGLGFVADNLPMQAGTNQYVAAIRDDAGNMGYATNVVVYSVVTNGTFGYDNAGCITNISHSGTGGYSDNLSLEWDERYRLTSVSSATSVANYTYDVLGRRTSCSVGSASQTNTTYFIYNGNQVIADLDEDGDVLRTYVWGTGIDNLLSFTDHITTNTYYPIKDIQNTVIALVDETGSVVETYDYDAWGRTKVYSATGAELTESAYGNRYCFQGREYDASTGLYYFRARWYSPETGRWLSKDPIGIAGGLNLYEFCGSNPVNFVDPDGLRSRGGYETPNDAAKGAFNEMRENGSNLSGSNEYGGFVRKNPISGKWYYTKPTEGDHANWPKAEKGGGFRWSNPWGEYTYHSHPNCTCHDPYVFSDGPNGDMRGGTIYMLPPTGPGRVWEPGMDEFGEPIEKPE